MSGENSSSAKESREKKPGNLDIAEVLRNGGADTLGRQLRLTLSLSLPSVFAQLSTIVMEYIDASMVGSLGAEASASIGIVSTTTWLFWGIGSAIVAGFSVQAAHLIGADKDDSTPYSWPGYIFSRHRSSSFRVGRMGHIWPASGMAWW